MRVAEAWCGAKGRSGEERTTGEKGEERLAMVTKCLTLVQLSIAGPMGGPMRSKCVPDAHTWQPFCCNRV
jgi:hypothetical protein